MAHRRALTLAAATAAAVGVAALVTPAGSSPEPTTAVGVAAAGPCEQPHLPVYGARTTGAGATVRQLWPEHPVTPPPTGGTDLDHVRPRYLAGPDTDDDGRGDQLDIDLGTGEQVMVIDRGDGVVRVGLKGWNLGLLTDRAPGDLDGDGRDEVMFMARPFAPGEDRTFVLPGVTPVGSHQADEVAIEIPGYSLYGAGDQLDGAGDDLVVADDPRGRSGLVSGTEVMKPGPGGSLTAFPMAVPLEGYPAGVFDLGDPRPAVATTGTDGSQLVVRLWRGGETTSFVTAGEDLGNTFFSVSMARAEGRTYLRAAAGDRGGGVFFAWDVDDPCRVLPAPTPGEDPGGTDPAPPADASTDTATSTG